MFSFLHNPSPQQQLLSSKLYSEANFYKAFIKDLKQAKRNIIIDSSYLTETRVKYLAPLLQKLTKRKIKVRINTRDFDHHNHAMRLQACKALQILKTTGVNVYAYKDRRHFKLAIIDKAILWEGSLNILSHSNSREVMRRSQSSKLCHRMIKFIN
ncbi:MAG: phospholipase D-like domain-containing protein [Candidatus Saccharibacteria bacterium]|nr:phospholipase D-like domain-containing protein [Candidatus Saccharibacteria bacterium]